MAEISAARTAPTRSFTGRLDDVPIGGKVIALVVLGVLLTGLVGLIGHRAVTDVQTTDRDLLATSVAERAATKDLQLAFARHLGLAPMAYVRRVRLEGAHRELQAADPTTGDTVAAIAARWGFGKPDRFAAVYRATFGVAPSHTLRT